MIRSLLDKLHVFQWIFPYTCLLCSQKSDRTLDLCSACENDLPGITSVCQQCGTPISETTMRCGKCLKTPPAFDRLIAPFSYEPPIQRLIIDLKFHHQLVNAKILGSLLAKRLSDIEKPDIIIPVPLHKKRLRERGFNQALEIAKPIAKHLNLPLDRLSCMRIRHTEPQSLTPAKLKHKNVKRAFEISQNFSGKHIAIIDDVVTSGHTVNELARTLKKAGAKKIDVWCCAKTIRD